MNPPADGEPELERPRDPHEAEPLRARGRPSASSRDAIEAVAIGLFLENGYAHTTVAAIASAAGISRTSFFRYYHSKAEIVWAAFDEHIESLGELLAEQPNTTPVMEAVRVGVVGALGASIDPEGIWMRRFEILDSSSQLRSEESVHWASWADTVAQYVARRTHSEPAAVMPQAIGGAMQAAFLAVLRSWNGVPDPGIELLAALDAELMPLCAVLQGWLDTQPAL